MNLEQLIQRQKEILSAAKAANRELTAEEQKEYDNIQATIDAILSARSEEQAQNKETATENGAEMNREERQAERKAERDRIREIESICRHFDVDSAQYVDGGYSVDAVRAAIIDKLCNENAPIQQRGTADVTKDEGDKFREAAVDALIMRSGMELEKPAEGARDLMGMSLRDLAIDSLEQDGVIGMNRRSADEVFTKLMERQYFNPTAAFPAILDQAIQKAYVEGHRTVAVTFDQITKKGTLKDFKIADNNYLAGPAGEFLEVPEGGELKHDVPSDAKRPQRQLKTYGRQFTLTRQAFINDDIDLVTRIPARYAASARKTINKQVYKILVDNPAIYDGTALFSAAHKNLMTSGSGITQQSMQNMILALQNQVDEFGEAIIVRPAKIVVPSGLAFDIYTLFNSPTINTTGNTQAVNPLFRYANQIQIIEDPTINVLCGGFGNTMPWFLLAAAEDSDFIEVDYLNGQEIPTIRRMEAPGTLGFIWDIYLDWGVNVMDFRGAIKNPGAVVADPL